MRLIVIAFISLATAGIAAQGLPRFEFGTGPGMLSYKIDGKFSNPGGKLIQTGGELLLDMDDQTEDNPSFNFYPVSSRLLGINTVFMARLPLGEYLAIAYSGRASFALDEIIHRVDGFWPADLALTIAGITGFELEIYPLGEPKGPWVAVLGGISVLNQPFVRSYFTQFGWGCGSTAGWRFSKNVALEANGMYMQTYIPFFAVDKVEKLDDKLSLSGSMHGWTISIGMRFGI